ncbi:MAG: hypothetical protein ACOY5C_04885 [Pseudomonadota bacterium]
MLARLSAWLLPSRARLTLGLAAILAGWAAWQHLQVIDLRGQRDRAVAEATRQAAALGSCQAEARRARADLAAQTLAVRAWRQAAEVQARRATAGQAAAAQVLEESRARAQRVLAAPYPSDCAAAVRRGAERGRLLGQQWNAMPDGRDAQ